LWSSLLRRQSEHQLGPWRPNRCSLSWVVSFVGQLAIQENNVWEEHSWTTQCHARQPSDSDFIVKLHTVQLYAIEHNFKSNRWIDLKLDIKIPVVLVYVRVKFRWIEVREGLTIQVRTCQTNFVIYFLLICALPIWQGSFTYKDVGACFWSFLVP